MGPDSDAAQDSLGAKSGREIRVRRTRAVKMKPGPGPWRRAGPCACFSVRDFQPGSGRYGHGTHGVYESCTASESSRRDQAVKFACNLKSDSELRHELECHDTRYRTIT